MPILSEGETIWRRCRADRAALLLDGAAYFGALRSALLQARHSVLIAGWDIDSRAPIHGTDADDDDAPAQLRGLLEHLAERRKDLKIRLLLWDYSIVYALERETLPALNLGWRTPPGVIVEMDDALPMGASHHQKIVVIDDTLAFCGGLDLAINRWDTAEHRPSHPDRRDPSGDPYGPFHDAQMVVDGEAASCLGELLRERWHRATDEKLEAPIEADGIWPAGVEADFESVDVGIARTVPPDEGIEAVTEVRELYLRSIREAERHVYIENQYLTVEEVADALAERLGEKAELEALIVTPRRPQGWLETKTMGVGQARFIARLDGDGCDRVRFCYPEVGSGDDAEDVMVHSKLLVVDVRMLSVGSSNLNNRSMGLDSECDLVIEASSPPERRRIHGILCRLLAHHTGRTTREVEALLEDRGSLLDAAADLSGPDRGLRELVPADEYDDLLADALNVMADREKPVVPTEFVGDMFGAQPRRSRVRRAARLVAAAAVLMGLVFAWNYTPLADWTDPEKVAAALESFRASNTAIPVLLAAFVVGGLALFPLTVLVAVAGMVLGPWAGFFCAMTGALASGAVGYGIGHGAGKRTLARMLGRRFRKIRRVVDRGGLIAVAAIRMVPIAPYTVVNVALGAVGVGFWSYISGTLLGLLPGILALTVLGDRMLQVWQDPEPANIGWFVLAIGVWLGLALGLQRLASRLKGG